jgi:hypothetical protein
MRKNILLSIAAFMAVMFFATSSAWAEGQHQCGKEGDGEHQCLHAKEGELQCLHPEKNLETKNAPPSAGMEEALESYFAILSSLSQDSMENVQTNAKDLADSTSKLAGHCGGSKDGCPESCRLGPLADASAAAKSLSEKTDISAARSEFGTLSEKLAEYLKNGQEEGSDKLYVFTCDMAKKIWLQKNEDPGNPYFGPSMAKCKRKIN